uniref:Reverse transcriptase domain-containing protein n=1 Tax=Oreochromis niloticus TaxID=8128 RepID=A0A669B2I4_ORENI
MTNSHNPRALFNTFNSVINPCTVIFRDASPALCDKFLKYFSDKIAALRASHPSHFSLVLDPVPASECLTVFQQFQPVSYSALKDIIDHLKISGSPHDILPSRFFKEALHVIGPCILSLLNASLSSGCVPSVFKHAVVQPIMKKKNLDPNGLTNYRPISKLPFISKILEKVVLKQLQAFLDANGINEKFQSGFKPRHSTETALLRVFNDLLLTVDSGYSVVLVLLDLTAAFDMVNHNILLSRLEHVVGLKGTVLSWFKSYLSERSFSVAMGQHSSASAPIYCGVPQGSVLGPALFSLYMLPLGLIFRKYNISFHCYADDIQIYSPLKSDVSASLQPLFNCLHEVKIWLSHNFLTLNENKTEIIVFGSHTPLDQLTNALGPLASHLSPTVRNLGVFLDGSFKLEKQVSTVVKNSFYQLRQISKAKSFLPLKELEKLVHAFITSRLDYCNSLYSGLQHSSLYRLQLIQNAAARLLTGTRIHEHITPILAKLHWLPVKYRINFKILLFTFQILNNLAPTYLSDLLHLYNPNRALRSSNHLLFAQPRSRMKSRGDRAFAIVAPRLWNNLPVHIRMAESIQSFRSRLKTYLFTLAFDSN